MSVKKDGKKEEKSGISIVLKIEMHCEGCMTKVLKTVKSIAGTNSAAVFMFSACSVISDTIVDGDDRLC